MNRLDWRNLSIDSLELQPEEAAAQLLPVLHDYTLQSDQNIQGYCKELLGSAQELIRFLFPFSPNESKFLDSLLDTGIMDATLLTDNPALVERIENQPLLHWKATNVRNHLSEATLH